MHVPLDRTQGAPEEVSNLAGCHNHRDGLYRVHAYRVASTTTCETDRDGALSQGLRTIGGSWLRFEPIEHQLANNIAPWGPATSPPKSVCLMLGSPQRAWRFEAVNRCISGCHFRVVKKVVAVRGPAPPSPAPASPSPAPSIASTPGTGPNPRICGFHQSPHRYLDPCSGVTTHE